MTTPEVGVGVLPARSAGARWFGGNMPLARLGLIINLCVPLALLIYDAMKGRLGADPINFAIHTTGDLALICLLLSLAVTPLRTLTGLAWLTQFRRSLGVFGFYYAACHLFIYFRWDQEGDLVATGMEIFTKIYLTIGFLALVLMTPLWATSFNGAIRALGGARWKWLHRLAYIAAILGGIHYYLQSKADKRKPELYLSILAVLLIWRYVSHFIDLRRAGSGVGTKAAPAFPVIPSAGAGKARFWKGELAVIGVFEETPSVRTFRLGPPDGGALPFTFKAGQFLSLALMLDGKRVTRSYTIASPPTRDGYVDLTIKHEEQGRVSGYLHGMCRTGQRIEVAAPAGRFTFEPAAEEGILLIAGGVGITPVMAILRELTDRCWGGKMDLVYSVRSARDIIFAEELRTLGARHPNVRVHVTITRDVPAEWAGLRGRITAELLREAVPDFAGRPAYLCGPDAMAAATREELAKAGVTRITVESFTPAAAVQSDAGLSPDAEMVRAGTLTATFSRSGKTVPVPAGRTVLEAAEAAGVRLDSDCRAGICGTCRCRLLSGNVTMTADDALTSADKAGGYILACQAYPTEPVTVEA